MGDIIRFDWALKRMLRDKANYVILEGLITSLLNKQVIIKSILESESNKDAEDNKSNRVDILAEGEKGELYLIEVQVESETAYFQRMLFGASKLVTEYIERGKDYGNIRKVYSINVVYFSLGSGSDYVYCGKTEFRGMHKPDEILQLTPFQKQKFNVDAISDLYPEYYILRVNDFNKWSKVSLEQWIYFLHNNEIPEDATAPGLQEARKKLLVNNMNPEERAAYYRHLDNAVILNDNIETALGEGYAKGHADGITETARNLKSLGVSIEQIAQATGLPKEEIERL